MSVEENKVLVREYFEAFANTDLAWMDERIAPDFVRHDPGLPFEVRGPEGVKRLNSILLTAFPDIRLDAVEDEIGEGDEVLARLTMRGTHSGEFMDIPPTGRGVEVPVLDLFRIADGKLAKHRAAIDNLGVMRHLGSA